MLLVLADSFPSGSSDCVVRAFGDGFHTTYWLAHVIWVSLLQWLLTCAGVLILLGWALLEWVARC